MNVRDVREQARLGIQEAGRRMGAAVDRAFFDYLCGTAAGPAEPRRHAAKTIAPRPPYDPSCPDQPWGTVKGPR